TASCCELGRSSRYTPSRRRKKPARAQRPTASKPDTSGADDSKKPTGGPRISSSPCLAVGAAYHHHVAIGVTQPHFAVAGRGVHVDVLDAFGPEATGSLAGSVQVVELEPDEHSVAVPPAVGIDEVRVVFLVPGVELEHERAIHQEPVVEVVVVR